MTCRILNTLDSEHWIKVSDKLTVGEFRELQDLGKRSQECFGQFRVLIELDDFAGWSKETGWENLFFLTEKGSRISKIAFVGDEKWKDEVFMFMGKPLLKTEIEFFPTDQLAQAKAWLCEDNSHSLFLA
jgi:hypothetical protein